MTRPRRFCPRNHDTFRFGRDAGHRCLKCRREDREAVLALQAAASAARDAERRHRQEDFDRRREREYQAALKAGGEIAANARWQRLSEQLDGRYDLCQWDLPESGLPGACTNRTTNVYCAKHSRQVEREAAQRRQTGG